MSRDKQNEIHELAKQMSEAISTEVEQRYIEDEAKLQAVLIENGWRKASEVAEEIFAEIEELLFDNKIHPCVGEDFEPYYLADLKDDIAELKKKYTKQE